MSAQVQDSNFHPPHQRPYPRMDSTISIEECPTSAEAEAVITPWIPQDIVDEILDHLALTDPDLKSLQSCALASKSWVQPCRRHLFHTAHFTSGSVYGWFAAFPVPEESPAHHVRDLQVWIGSFTHVPEWFFGYTSWFTNAEKVVLLGDGGLPPLRVPSLWRLPQSVTALTVQANVVNLVQIRDVMALLPNLDDLTLTGYPDDVDEDMLPGIGATLKGGFGGRLILSGGCVGEDVGNMLLEIPTRLHFTEVGICAMHQCFPSTVRVVEACGKTLVNLSYMANCYGKSCPLSRSGWF